MSREHLNPKSRKAVQELQEWHARDAAIAQLGARVLEILRTEFVSGTQYETKAAELMPAIEGAARALGLLPEGGKS